LAQYSNTPSLRAAGFEDEDDDEDEDENEAPSECQGRAEFFADSTELAEVLRTLGFDQTKTLLPARLRVWQFGRKIRTSCGCILKSLMCL
jgi:hypothetical protein